MDLITQWLLVAVILAVFALIGAGAWMERNRPSRAQTGLGGVPPSSLLPRPGVRIVDSSVPVSKQNRIPYDQDGAE